MRRWIRLSVLFCLILSLCSCGKASYFQQKESMHSEQGNEKKSEEKEMSNERGSRHALGDASPGDSAQDSSGGRAFTDQEKAGAVTSSRQSRGAGENLVYAQIMGAVRLPGVYRLPRASRVQALIEAAGGALEDADLTALNQAAKVEDGSMYYLPHRGEQESASAAGDALVDINRASKEELMRLPGIGQTRADAIIAFRKDKGPFHKKEDIKKIPGFKEAAFAKIKDKIKVN